MSTHATAKELRAMQVSDLQREVMSKKQGIAKMRLGIEMRSFKDTALYGREKKELARMLTVLGEKSASAATPDKQRNQKSELKAESKTSTVPARRAASKRRGTSSRSARTK